MQFKELNFRCKLGANRILQAFIIINAYIYVYLIIGFDSIVRRKRNNCFSN